MSSDVNREHAHLQVLLLYYASGREEIKERITGRSNLLLLHLGAVVTLLGVVLEGNSEELLFAVPFLSLAAAAGYAQHDAAIGRLSHYLKETVAAELNLIVRSSTKSWEQDFLGYWPINQLRLVSGLLLVALPQVGTLLIAEPGGVRYTVLFATVMLSVLVSVGMLLFVHLQRSSQERGVRAVSNG